MSDEPSTVNRQCFLLISLESRLSKKDQKILTGTRCCYIFSVLERKLLSSTSISTRCRTKRNQHKKSCFSVYFLFLTTQRTRSFCFMFALRVVYCWSRSTALTIHPSTFAEVLRMDLDFRLCNCYSQRRQTRTLSPKLTTCFLT